MSRDPVCGKEVDSLRARAVGIWGGRTYYFCSPEHKAEFARDPVAYGEHGAREPTIRAALPSGARTPTPPGRAVTPAPVRIATPAPVRVATPSRGSRSSTETDAEERSAGEPVGLPASGSPMGAQPPALTDETAAVAAEAAPSRGSLVKLAVVCVLALAAGVLFVLLRH